MVSGASHASEKPGDFVGFLQRKIGLGGLLQGWVLDRAKKGESQRVILSLDGEDFAEVVADAPRGDLGANSGRHGFNVPLPEKAFAAGRVTISARVAGSEFVLGHCPLTLDRSDLREALLGEIDERLARLSRILVDAG